VFKKAVLDRFSEDSKILQSRYQNFLEFQKKKSFVQKVKEEKYQDGFLKDIFENSLGYILENSDPEKASIFREEKNETDGKKADGVIRIGGKVIGIIELKDHKTKNLNLVEEQAFNYHNSHSNSKYIIISNFTELRFYIDKKTEFESFKLFEMDFKEFETLHKILSFESISENLPLQFLEQSQNFERDISEKFYKDFSEVREKISEEISEKNEISDLDSLNSAQKILDRLVFLFFGESRGLLKFSKTYILETWKNDIYENPLWETLKIIFRKVDVGGKIPKTYAYNGGLFAKDENLDSLKIGDDVLEKAVNLGTYDFSTELDVNILGHIFENSLDDLQKLQNSEKIRKRDGVFYTPQYITKYIVENTVGELCRENWKKIVKNETETELLEYRKFLENLRILDPAVGSGAFLNETLDFLVKEHEKLREKLLPFGDLTLGYEFDKEILENNLFGVDINSSAIEIAKLSLWIRTAKPNRKLSNLNENLKVANSLLEMPFDENSFDIVLGNPPYGAKLEKSELFETNETFILFYKLGNKMLKEKGYLGFITPDSWLVNKNGSIVREMFLNNGSLTNIYDVYKPFKDAPDVWCNIPIFAKGQNYKTVKIKRDFPHNLEIFQFSLNWNNFIDFGIDEWFPYINQSYLDIFQKMKEFPKMENFFDVRRGFSPTPNKKNLTTSKTDRQVIGGEDFRRYETKIKEKFLIDSYSKSQDSIANVMLNDFIGIQRIRTNSLDFKSRWLVANFFEKGFVPIDSIGFFLKTSSLELKFLLAVLNSKLMNLFYKLHFTDKNVKPTYLKKIPIPEISIQKQKPMIQLVDEVIELKSKISKFKKHFDKLSAVDKIEISEEIEKSEKRISEIENELDETVFKLYNLTEEEIEIL
jgi:type I restriction-modification system DNA methylase subunit